MATHPPEPHPDKIPDPADLPVEPDFGPGESPLTPRDPDTDWPIEPPR